MHRILTAVLLGIATLVTLASAQTAPATQTLISFRDGSVSQVVTTPPKTLHDFLGVQKLDVQAYAFGGFNLTADGRLTGGVAVTKRWALAKEVPLDLGFYVRSQADRTFDAGIFLGVSFAWGRS